MLQGLTQTANNAVQSPLGSAVLVILTFLGGGVTGLVGAWVSIRTARVSERKQLLEHSEALFTRYKGLHDDCEKRYTSLHQDQIQLRRRIALIDGRPE